MELIKNAKSQICLLAYEFVPGEATNKVEEALIRAAGQGVAVRVLVDNEVPGADAFVERLLAGGASAQLDDVGTAHAKMLVADQSFALVGSTNLSTSSLRFNHEVNLLFSDPLAVGTALNYCTGRQGDVSLWFDVASPAGSNPQVFGDRARGEVLKEAIEAAQERIDIVIYTVNATFEDGPASDLLKQEHLGFLLLCIN